MATFTAIVTRLLRHAFTGKKHNEKQGVTIRPAFCVLEDKNMMKFNLAVIDTALNIDAIPESIRNKIVIKDYFGRDTKATHSAMVINILLKYINSDLIEKIYLYNIFTKEHQGSGLAAFNALEDILKNNDVDIIIMSVTLANKERYEQTKDICKRLALSGVTIIAADSNRPSEGLCYPFSFDCVYGISQGAFTEKPYFCVNDMGTKHISGDAEAEFINCGNIGPCLFGGTSKAVPKFASAIINAFADENDNSCDKIEEWIKKSALSEEDNIIRQIRENALSCEFSQEILDELYGYISECPTDISCFGEISPTFELCELGSCELYKFITFMLNKFRISATPEDMRYTDFATIGSFCAYIGEKIHK